MNRLLLWVMWMAVGALTATTLAWFALLGVVLGKAAL